MTGRGAGLLTFGHGTADRPTIVRLLRDAEVGLLVDVRRFPASRHHPHVARDELARWLPQGGVAYRWERGLGGRRRLAAPDAAASPDTWWQVEAFRAYAGYTRTDEFAAAMSALLDAADEAAPARTVVMCSETVWWRCHRRLISDVAVLLHERGVEHLGHDGRRTAHPPSAGACVTPAGLVYDRPA
jgi:uncharacterized protein (DUF488 family)